MIAQYLAALHPECFDHIALMLTATEVSDAGKDIESRTAAALARGDISGAGVVAAEAVVPGKRMRWARRLIGPFLARFFFAGSDSPPEDLMVEVHALKEFNSEGT